MLTIDCCLDYLTNVGFAQRKQNLQSSEARFMSEVTDEYCTRSIDSLLISFHGCLLTVCSLLIVDC